ITPRDVVANVQSILDAIAIDHRPRAVRGTSTKIEECVHLRLSHPEEELNGEVVGPERPVGMGGGRYVVATSIRPQRRPAVVALRRADLRITVAGPDLALVVGDRGAAVRSVEGAHGDDIGPVWVAAGGRSPPRS